jgi:hypothetical protein
VTSGLDFGTPESSRFGAKKNKAKKKGQKAKKKANIFSKSQQSAVNMSQLLLQGGLLALLTTQNILSGILVEISNRDDTDIFWNSGTSDGDTDTDALVGSGLSPGPGPDEAVGQQQYRPSVVVFCTEICKVILSLIMLYTTSNDSHKKISK